MQWFCYRYSRTGVASGQGLRALDSAMPCLALPTTAEWSDAKSLQVPSMRQAAVLLLMCAVAGVASAEQERRVVAPAILAAIADDDATTLPRSLTPAERALWRAPNLALVPKAAPAPPVRAQAEYEENDGILIRWGSQNALLTEMTVAVTTLTADARVYIVVSGSSQQSTATTTLTTAGADMSQVEFIIAATNSVWMRDYGPRYVDHNGARAIIDHVYNRPRPQDDAFPGVLSSLWSEPKFDIPLVHGGGNFHLFGDRRAFMTRLISNENPGLSDQQIIDYYQAYQGLDVTLVTPFPSSFDSTQHIDMWVLPVDDDEVIVSSYPASVGTPSTISDEFAAARSGEGYTVYRTPGWQALGDHYTYANAVVINELVMICRFDGYDTENAQALATFQTAFQDHTVVQVDCSDIIGLAGAIHCIVMHVPRMQTWLLFRDDFE
jgi:agmatine deiminase